MGTIGFDKSAFEGVAIEANKFCNNLTASKENVLEQITTIGNNWEGQQYEAARSDFDTITNNMSSIVENARNITKVLNDVSSGFSELKYK